MLLLAAAVLLSLLLVWARPSYQPEKGHNVERS